MDMKRHLRHFSFLLVILALVSAGISPACAFISGKTSLIEICAADGEIKTVAVTEDGRQVQPGAQDKAGNDCVFCLNAATAKSGPAGGQILYVLAAPAPAFFPSSVAAPADIAAKPFHATGPPASFLL